MLDDVKLSDLFFNHEHPTYDALFGRGRDDEEGPTREEMEAAIARDAADFAEQFPEFGKGGPWYYADFFDRL